MRETPLYFTELDFSNAEERAYAREELVYNVTEDLLVILEDLNVNKAELARRLNKSKSYVSQILSGSRNMTLGTLSDICLSLGFKPEISLPVDECGEQWSIIETDFERYGFDLLFTEDVSSQLVEQAVPNWENFNMNVAA